MALPSVTFSHAGIYVKDLPKMQAFYENVLGLVETDRGVLDGTEIVFMSNDPKEHHQIVLASGRPAFASFTTVNQLSFHLDDLTALKQMQTVLREAGVTPLAPTSHGTAVSIYFHDPEGNRIELYVDTKWHVPQPRRILINLDRSEDEIMKDEEQMATTAVGYLPGDERYKLMVERMAEAKARRDAGATVKA
jgi:catechol-2,3-dioxygenase